MFTETAKVTKRLRSAHRSVSKASQVASRRIWQTGAVKLSLASSDMVLLEESSSCNLATTFIQTCLMRSWKRVLPTDEAKLENKGCGIW